jgi:regulator of replication initiation timing
MKNETKISETVKKTKNRWSRSTSKDNITTNIEVRELDGEGFLICLSKYGQDKNGKYIDIPSKEFFSKTNPLDDADKKDDFDNLQDLFKTPIEKLINE